MYTKYSYRSLINTVNWAFSNYNKTWFYWVAKYHNPTEDKVVEILILAVIRLANKENIIMN